MLGNGWSVPYQSTLVIDPSGDAELETVGEPNESVSRDARGGFFESDDGDSLVDNANGTHTITATDGESDTYTANGTLVFHCDAQGDRITFDYDASGQADFADGFHRPIDHARIQRCGPARHADDLVGRRDNLSLRCRNQFLVSVASFDGTTNYSYNDSNNELTSVQIPMAVDQSDLRLLWTLAHPCVPRLLTLSYQPGEISSIDALNHTASRSTTRTGCRKNGRRPGHSHVFHLRRQWQLASPWRTPSELTYQYTYDGSGNLASMTDPLGSTTQMTYTAQGELASYTDANSNVTSLSYTPSGTLSAITYPDGSQEQFTLNGVGEADVDRSARRPGD